LLQASRRAAGLENVQLSELKSFGSRVNKLGATFAVCNCKGEVLLLCEVDHCAGDHAKLKQYAMLGVGRWRQGVACGGAEKVFLLDGDRPVLTAILDQGDDHPFVAVVDGSGRHAKDGERLKELSSRCNIDRGDLTRMLQEVSRTHLASFFMQMLDMLAEDFHVGLKIRDQMEVMGNELAQSYEELVLLHKLGSNMKVTESDANYLQMACDSLTDIVGVEGIVVLLEKTIDDEKHLVVAAGSGVIDVDEEMAAVLQNRLAEELSQGKDALLDSEVDSPFKYDWPENVRNIIVVPLFGTDRGAARGAEDAATENSMIGLMVAVNRQDKPDFDSTDAKLFNSVANSCAVFVENGRLFGDLKELFVGSLKALTSSIDAKDQYTRGHSERVAFISRWIGERLAERNLLDSQAVHRLYLAGLLHDIGKMGIDESILRKKGKLSEKELEHIRSHPAIGAGILNEIKQMRPIVAAVLCHHERVDGKGYPNGLTGDQIPILGKIVALADGFDAMTSKRVYRDALTLEQALAEIKKGLGTQFDEKIGTIFLESNVYELWDAIQDGSDFVGLGGKSTFAEYGTMAVGTLIK